MASLDYQTSCAALTQAGPHRRDTFLANLPPLSDPGSMTVDVVMRCTNEVQASATVDLMCVWVPNRTRDAHASNLRRIEAVLTPTNMSYPKAICACNYSRWLDTPASLFTTTACVSVKNVCKKKKGFKTVCGDCLKLRQSAEQKPVQQLASPVPMEAEQTPPTPPLPALPSLYAGQPLPMQVEEGGQQGMAEQEQQSVVDAGQHEPAHEQPELDILALESFACGGACDEPAATESMQEGGGRGSAAELSALDSFTLGGDCNGLDITGCSMDYDMGPLAPQPSPGCPPLPATAYESSSPVQVPDDPSRSTRPRQSTDKHIAAAEAGSAEKRTFGRAVQKAAQGLVKQSLAEVEAHRRAAAKQTMSAEKAAAAAVFALAEVGAQLQREQQQQLKTDKRKEAAVEAAEAQAKAATGEAAQTRAAQKKAEVCAERWRLRVDKGVQQGRDECKPEMEAQAEKIRGLTIEVGRLKRHVDSKDGALEKARGQIKRQKAEMGAVAEEARQQQAKSITRYLGGRLGRPPAVIQQALQDGPFQRSGSKADKEAARDLASLQDRLHECEAKIAELRKNGGTPIFVKDSQGSYPVAAMVMVFEMLTHLDSVESIEKDLLTMHVHVYPDHVRGTDYTIPSSATLRKWRSCSQYFTEIIAAVRIGFCVKWKQLFHDASSDRKCTKIFSTLLKIEESGNLVTLLLRGLHLIDGGTSADELADIRLTISRMAEKVTLLRNQMARDGLDAGTIDILVNCTGSRRSRRSCIPQRGDGGGAQAGVRHGR